MADNEIGVNVVVNPAAAQAGAQATVDAINNAASAINTSLKSVVTSSNSTAAAIRSGFAGVEDQLNNVQKALQAVAATAAGTTNNITNNFKTVNSAANNAAGGMNNLAKSGTGVRREFLVLGHEISQGQWTRLGGSLIVLAERMDLLSKLTSPAGIGIGILAGAVALLVVAAVKGSEEMSKLNNSLELTGNAAGLTRDKYLEMGNAIAAANAKISVGSARDAVGATAATGMFSPAAMQAVSAAVAEITRLSGKTAESVANDFAKMDEGVAKWADENKEAKDLVSAADMEYARHLEEMGQKEESEIYIAQRISDRLHQVQQDLGVLPSLWNEVANAASGAWRAMMGIGVPDTLSTQISKLQERKAALQDQGLGKDQLDALGGGVDLNQGDTVADLDAQIAALKKKQQTQDDAAKSDAAQAANNRASKEGASALDKMADQYNKASAKAHELKEAQDALNKSLQGLPPAAERTATQRAYATQMESEYGAAVAGINARGARKPQALSASGAGAVGRAEDTGELALIKDRLSTEQKQMEQSYKANEITLQQYYDARRRIVQEGMQAEIVVANRGVGNAQQAAGSAKGPNQQAEAQARITTAKNRVALLNQQLAEQEADLTSQEQQQAKLQENKLATIQIQSQLVSAQSKININQQNSEMEVALGKESKKELIAQEVDYENQRYALEVAAMQKRAALENQSVTQQAELNAQLESAEGQHQQKINALQAAATEQNSQLNKTATDDITQDFTTLFTSIADGTKTAKNAFLEFFTQVQKQITGIFAKQLVSGIFGGGGQGGSGSVGGGGILQGLLGAIGLGGSGAAGLLGGIGSLTGSFAGAFGSGAGSAGSVGGGNPLTSLMAMFGMGASGGGAAAGDSFTSALGGAATGAGAGSFGLAGGLGGVMAGMPAYAKGTNYVPSTQLALLHKGEAVVPANVNNGGSQQGAPMTVIQNFTGSQNQDRRTQSQIAAQAGWGVNRALKRNG